MADNRMYRATIESLDADGSMHMAGGGASGFTVRLYMDRDTFNALQKPSIVTVEVIPAAQS